MTPVAMQISALRHRGKVDVRNCRVDGRSVAVDAPRAVRVCARLVRQKANANPFRTTIESACERLRCCHPAGWLMLLQ